MVGTIAGAILRDDFVRPMGISARELARRMKVPPNRVTGLMEGRRRITADTAVRLARAFGTSAEFWMNLQVAEDLDRLGYRREIPVIEGGQGQATDALINRPLLPPL